MPDASPRHQGAGVWLALLSLGAGLAASAWILARSGGTLASISAVPWAAHLLALLALSLDLVARGARITCIARGLGQPLSVRASVHALLAADAVAAVTPARVGSDPAKIAVLHSGGVRAGTAGALVLGEMWAESLVLVAFALLIAALAHGLRWVAFGLLGYAAVATAASLAALLLSRALPDAPPRIWFRLRLGAERWTHTRLALGEFRVHAKRLRSLPAAWALGAACATVVHVAARLAILPILALPLFVADAQAPAWAELVLLPFFVLYATALLPPPGGGGGVEVVFAAALAETLGPSALAATVLWWRVYTFYLGAATGALVLFSPRGRLPAPIRVQSTSVTDPLPVPSPSCDMPTASCGYGAR